MNTTLVYLIITMSSKFTMSYAGYGGISVTVTPSYEVCEMLKSDVTRQLSLHSHIDMNDVIITCKKY